MTPQPRLTASKAYRQFTDFLNTRGIPYCVIGPHDSFPENVTGDLDIVLDPSSLKTDFHNIIAAYCANTAMRPVQHVWHETGAHSYVLWLGNRVGRDGFIKLDLSGDYQPNGRYLLSAKEIVAGRRKALGANGSERCFYVPAPEKEFTYYLLSKIDKLNLADVKARHLTEVWNGAPGPAREKLSCFWSRPETERIVDCAEKNEWTWVQNNLTRLRKKMHTNAPGFSIRTRIKEWKRIGNRILHPTGLTVVFLGPDGSGKTTLIGRVMKDMEPVFARAARCYLFPVPLDGHNRPPSPDPHSAKSWNTLASMAKLGLWLTRYWAGWLRHILFAKIRSTVIYFDRYYDDILVDSRRYRYGGPVWLARLVRKLVPRPDLFILLDAPAEVLHRRKKELPLEETERQRKAYLDLIKGMSHGVTIDASQPLDAVVADTGKAILEFVAERTAKRIGM